VDVPGQSHYLLGLCLRGHGEGFTQAGVEFRSCWAKFMKKINIHREKKISAKLLTFLKV
jgi:hypothetical protein